MLTPRDIHQAQFKRVWKGYSPEEVDEFLRRVVLEYERVYKENEALKGTIAELEKRLAEYASTETQIGETLELARRAAADARSAAEREAGAILREARSKADALLQAASHKAAEEERRAEVFALEFERRRALVTEALRQMIDQLQALGEPLATMKMRPALREVAAAADPDLEAAVRDGTGDGGRD